MLSHQHSHWLRYNHVGASRLGDRQQMALLQQWVTKVWRLVTTPRRSLCHETWGLRHEGYAQRVSERICYL